MAMVVNGVVKGVARPRNVWMRERAQANLRLSIETYLDDVKTGVSEGFWDQSGGNLCTGQTRSGV